MCLSNAHNNINDLCSINYYNIYYYVLLIVDVLNYVHLYYNIYYYALLIVDILNYLNLFGGIHSEEVMYK